MSEVSDLYDVRDGAVVLRVQVSPGAGRTAVTGRHGDAMKVRVAAPPVEGRANAALVEFLATEFGLKAADVTLLSGATGRAKRFRLGGLDPDEADTAMERLLATVGAGGQRRTGRR
ncbi:MAG TPA: DUF167 domain-containing protein [Acidimicrobiia bacterium]|nr:DUF167 domain-containing protein [Acidimicrobiia bacterium]